MPNLRRPILDTIEVDFGYAAALVILWFRPFGAEPDQDWPTFFVAMVALVIGVAAGSIVLERRLPQLRATRPRGKDQVTKRNPRMILAGWGVGLVALLIAEVATRSGAPVGFTSLVGIGASMNVWLPTECLGRLVAKA